MQDFIRDVLPDLHKNLKGLVLFLSVSILKLRLFY